MPVLLLLPVFVSEDALLLYNSSLFVPLLQDQGLSVACISFLSDLKVSRSATGSFTHIRLRALKS